MNTKDLHLLENILKRCNKHNANGLCYLVESTLISYCKSFKRLLVLLLYMDLCLKITIFAEKRS